MSKLIAKLREPNEFVNGNFLICKGDREGVYLTKNEYLDGNGKPESTSVGWSEVGTSQLRHILALHFSLPTSEIDSILAM